MTQIIDTNKSMTYENMYGSLPMTLAQAFGVPNSVVGRVATDFPSDVFSHLSGSQQFYRFVWDAATTHHAKNQDYASKEDPFKNFRAGEFISVSAYKMALLRFMEKVQRLRQVEENGGETVTGESVDETLRDLMVLAGICRVLRDEQ